MVQDPAYAFGPNCAFSAGWWRSADVPPLFEETAATPTGNRVQRLEMEAGLKLAIEYKEFLRQQNGGEGFIGSAYVILWRVEDLLAMDESYQVHEYAPGLFLFGSDGGGEVFAFDTRTEAKSIVSVPFIGMGLNEARPVASNFNEFLKVLFKS